VNETKQARIDTPSGWLYLTKHPAVPFLIDALLELPPEFEFTIQHIAERAGVTRQTASKHLGLFVEVGLVRQLDDHGPSGARQYVVKRSATTKELYALNSAINATSDRANQEKGVSQEDQ
jgi:predicted transcriptional regulator